MGVSKTNKTYASRYKTDVSVSQTSNVGFDATTRKLCSGDGADSALSLSDDVLSVQPVNDNTTGTMIVKNQGGSNIFAVNTTDSKVLIGVSQVAANTQYAHFGVDNSEDSPWQDDKHYIVPYNVGSLSSATQYELGSATSSSFNDTEPPTSFQIDTNDTGNATVAGFWYLPDSITIDAVHWFVAGDTSTADNCVSYLMAYDVVTDGSSSGGDLSNGVKLAGGVVISVEGRFRIEYQSMSLHSADVDAGKVILFTFAQETENSDHTINATVKYHIR